MRLLYGTTNQGKLDVMKRAVSKLEIEIYSLLDMTQPVPSVDETGNSPLENARIKAEMYYKAFGVPVFSCDSGLYFENVPEELQPGVHIRTVNGKYLTDEEMIDYYSKMAEKYGPIKARYKNAVSLIFNEKERYESMDESLWGESFLIVSRPYEKRVPGLPLDSLSVEIKSGKYYYERDNSASKEETVDSVVEIGFYHWFKKIYENR